MEAAVEPDHQHDSGLVRGHLRAEGSGERQTERLLHKNMLAGAGGADHLLGVLGMRRGEDDGIDIGLVKDRFERTDPAQAGVRTESRGGRLRSGVRCGEAYCVAVAHTVDEILPPPAQSDDRRPYHPFPPPISLSSARMKSCITRARASASA